MKRLPAYVGVASFILQLVIGGFTAGLMFEHGKQVWGCVLVTAMLAVLLFQLVKWLSHK